MHAIRYRHPRPMILCRSLLLLTVLAASLARPVGAAEPSVPVTVSFFGAGGEDAVLLHQAGRCALLVDAGPRGSGIRIGEALERRGVEGLDQLVISHPHLDHFGGVLTLPTSLEIAMVHDNGGDNGGEPGFADYRRWRRHFPYQPLAAGAKWRCGEIEVSVLAADSTTSRPEKINDGSIVLAVTVGSVRLLLPGDIEAGGRRALARRPGALRADIVKIPHHAKDAGGLGPWLDAVRPALAVISTGKDTVVDPAALELVRASSGEVWRTDLQGDLEIRIDARGWHHVGQ
ncbi:MBL fold metallo-hydrolase [Desulfoprunum benzoelyticum]|uniref:Beta-lactamase superfamily II metal-dependent hydrolase n=1 Tax=Desulfoprunum benzoelyticum TaxID=1506996 RepID=A0A840UXN5_9BACT|nr:MBL fold metallo-hydrolase [Desulfoprunum benzoelyticum]MBB5347438.1 beta-lactamase superfamily II metal-dependent hydrolase [Desulfoprunum benzoelyticum]MBM9529683.1 MBL fold metallo-hydrolase [Desulfoprunum benzoelyticum]